MSPVAARHGTAWPGSRSQITAMKIRTHAAPHFLLLHALLAVLLAGPAHSGERSGAPILNDAAPALVAPTLDTRLRYEYGNATSGR